jgi:hypothetical protein
MDGSVDRQDRGGRSGVTNATDEPARQAGALVA